MVASVNPSSLRMSWQLPPEIDHNGEITGYVIEYTRVGGSSDTVTVPSGTMHTISGLVSFVVYSVRVAAINIIGTGPFSDPAIELSGENSEFVDTQFKLKEIQARETKDVNDGIAAIV